MNTLANVRPEDLARKAAMEPLIGIVAREHGDAVIASLSDSQKFAVLDELSDARLLNVIARINAKAGGSFKYVGDGDVKVILGAGPQELEGWLATDIDHLNVVKEASWHRLFDPESIDRLLAEHVLEHLSLRELDDALKLVYKYLKPGGRLRLAVPDAFHPSRYYYNLVKPGGWETPFEHMLFLDHEMLSRIASALGFEVHLLEYFDESGIFHSIEYSSAEGSIRRCARNNVGLDMNNTEVMGKFYSSIPEHLRQQFIDRRMTYTSLIADLTKPR